MTTDHAELFSALMDREAVDPDALARALEDPEARRALVGFATVRRELHAPAPGEAAWLAAQAPRLAASRPRFDRWRLVAAAAVLLAAGLGAGVVAERYRNQQRPPEPTRVVQLDPLPVNP
jgi:negative regulator of sigma E activity